MTEPMNGALSVREYAAFLYTEDDYKVQRGVPITSSTDNLSLSVSSFGAPKIRASAKGSDSKNLSYFTGPSLC